MSFPYLGKAYDISIVSFKGMPMIIPIVSSSSLAISVDSLSLCKHIEILTLKLLISRIEIWIISIKCHPHVDELIRKTVISFP